MSDPTEGRLVATLTLSTPAGPVAARVALPAGLCGPTTAVHAARQLAEPVYGATATASAQAGQPLSCARGCDACCHHPVPLSALEALALVEALGALPAAARAAFEARRAQTEARLAETGVDRLVGASLRGERVPVGQAWFEHRIACPALEDRACGLYAERPLVCREFSVTTPAAWCADPRQGTPRLLPLPARLSGALARLSAQLWPEAPRQVPLPWAPALAARLPPVPERPGQAWLEALLGALR